MWMITVVHFSILKGYKLVHQFWRFGFYPHCPWFSSFLQNCISWMASRWLSRSAWFCFLPRLHRKHNYWDRLGRRPHFANSSLGRKQETANSVGVSQIWWTVFAESGNWRTSLHPMILQCVKTECCKKVNVIRMSIWALRSGSGSTVCAYTVSNLNIWAVWLLTLKAPNKNCSRWHFDFLLLSFEGNKAWFFMLAEDSFETSSLIFSEKQWKKYLWMLSAAVMIGALRVKFLFSAGQGYKKPNSL